MTEHADNPRTASCPICGKPAGEKFRPFCSKRCADVDLNRWLSGVYAVPGKEEEDEDGARTTARRPRVPQSTGSSLSPSGERAGVQGVRKFKLKAPSPAAASHPKLRRFRFQNQNEQPGKFGRRRVFLPRPLVWTARNRASITARALLRPPSGGRGAQVAQLVEHCTENAGVGGSNPPLGTTVIFEL